MKKDCWWISVSDLYLSTPHFFAGLFCLYVAGSSVKIGVSGIWDCFWKDFFYQKGEEQAF